MQFIKNLFVKLVGKKLGGALEKTGLSKTKLTAVIGVIIYAVEHLGPVFGHPIVIPPDVYTLLGAVGLWSLRDGIDAQKQDA